MAYGCGQSGKLSGTGLQNPEILDTLDWLRKTYTRYKNAVSDASLYPRFDKGNVDRLGKLLVDYCEEQKCKCIIKAFDTYQEAKVIRDEPAKVYFMNGQNITDLINLP